MAHVSAEFLGHFCWLLLCPSTVTFKTDIWEPWWHSISNRIKSCPITLGFSGANKRANLRISPGARGFNQVSLMGGSFHFHGVAKIFWGGNRSFNPNVGLVGPKLVPKQQWYLETIPLQMP